MVHHIRGLIITQDSKRLDLKPDGVSRVVNNLPEFLHSLTDSGMFSAAFQVFA